MKKLCLIFTLLIIPFIGFSQFTGDSIIVYLNNRVEINAAVKDYFELKSSDKVVLALRDFQKLLPDIESQLSAEKADLVKFSVGKSITVEPGESTYTFLIKNDALSNTGYRDKAVISGEDFKIFITTADFTKISDLSLSESFEKVVAILPAKTRMAKALYYECIDDKVTEIEEKSETIGRTDFLEFTPGAGAGLIKSTWVADLSFHVGLGLSKKSTLKYSPYVSTNIVFDFDAEDNINLNTFINLGFSWNVDQKAEKPDLLGVELGYLVSKHGDLFGENTFKFGLSWSPLGAVWVSPHLYITDNFDTVYPGIRIGFGF